MSSVISSIIKILLFFQLFSPYFLKITADVRIMQEGCGKWSYSIFKYYLALIERDEGENLNHDNLCHGPSE
jgi:hypothetical protein